MTEIYFDRIRGRILRLHHFLRNDMAVFTDIADGSITQDSIDALFPAEIAVPDCKRHFRPEFGWEKRPYKLFNGPGSIRFVLIECLRLAACAALVGLFTLIMIGLMP